MTDGRLQSGVQAPGERPGRIFPRFLPVGRVREADYVFFVVFNACALLGTAVHLAFIPAFAWVGVRPMALLNIASTALWAISFLGNRLGWHRSALVIALLEGSVHAAGSVHYAGWYAGFQYYLFLAPLIVFFAPLRRLASKLALVLLPTATYVGLDLYSALHEPLFPIGFTETTLLRAANLVITLSVLSAVSYYYHRITQVAHEGLRRANQRLADLAATDPLTGLLNRRHLLQRIHGEEFRARRFGRGFAMLMVDLDHFKTVNDRYGHEIGDRVLVAVAGLLRSAVRGSDSVARWGGEEFLLLLPETDLEGARQVAEKIRRLMAEMQVEGLDRAHQPSMTLGVAYCAPGRSAEDCLRRADQALYAGKITGRNRVVTEPGENEDADLGAGRQGTDNGY